MSHWAKLVPRSNSNTKRRGIHSPVWWESGKVTLHRGICEGREAINTAIFANHPFCSHLDPRGSWEEQSQLSPAQIADPHNCEHKTAIQATKSGDDASTAKSNWNNFGIHKVGKSSKIFFSFLFKIPLIFLCGSILKDFRAITWLSPTISSRQVAKQRVVHSWKSSINLVVETGSKPLLALLHPMCQRKEGRARVWWNRHKSKTYVWLRNNVGETTTCLHAQYDILRPNHKQCVSFWKLSEFIEQIAQQRKSRQIREAGNSAISLNFKRKHSHFPHPPLLKLCFQTSPLSECRINADENWDAWVFILPLSSCWASIKSFDPSGSVLSQLCPERVRLGDVPKSCSSRN